MAVVLLIVRVLLAVTFAVAGLAKLRDRDGTAAAAVGLGLPARVAPTVARVLPAVELVLAAALVPAGTARPAAVVAAVLLGAFTTLVLGAVATGRTVECHCFGSAGTHPAGPRTLARNAGLIAAAGVVAWSPGGAPLALPTTLAGSRGLVVVGALVAFGLVAAVAVQGWFLVRLYGQQGRLLARIGLLEGALAAPVGRDGVPGQLPGLAVGSAAPAFALVGADGSSTTLEDLRAPGQPVVLVFSAPSCAACMVLQPDLVAFQAEHGDRVTLAVLSAGSTRAVAHTAGKAGLRIALADPDRAVAAAYGAEGTPAAVLVLPDGSIGSPLALGPAAVQGLVDRVARPDLLPLAPGPHRRPGRPAHAPWASASGRSPRSSASPMSTVAHSTSAVPRSGTRSWSSGTPTAATAASCSPASAPGGSRSSRGRAAPTPSGLRSRSSPSARRTTATSTPAGGW